MQLSFVIRQKSYEKIAYVLRRHPVTFVPTIVIHTILLLIPPLLYWVIHTLYPQIFLLAGVVVGATLLASVYTLFILMFFYSQFTIFYLDLGIVTNDRLVDIEQLGLFSRRIGELDLYQIQDVTSTVNGFFATLFHYGNLTILTASVNLNIVLSDIPRPEFYREEILRLANEDRKFHVHE